MEESIERSNEARFRNKFKVVWQDRGFTLHEVVLALLSRCYQLGWWLADHFRLLYGAGFPNSRECMSYKLVWGRFEIF